MTQFEALLYELTKLFLYPVLFLILLALLYALLALGGFAAEWWQRHRQQYQSVLAAFSAQSTLQQSDDLELWIMRRLERLKVITRVSPMLGLVATMISIGPALLALGEGDVAQVSNNMVVAFSAVILSLLAASITFMVLTIRRRWLLEELRSIERMQQAEVIN